MKSNKVVKFTLTAICMAVLSACGSDGDSKPAISSTTNTTTQQQQEAAAKAAAEKAAAEKAAAEKAAAEKAAAEKAAAEKAAAAKAAAEKAAAEKAAAAKAAAEKAAAEKAAAEKAAAEAAKNAANTEGLNNAQLILGQITVDEKAKSHVGAKHVTKNSSDFILNNKGNFANNPTAMNVQLHPALDTVVVAEPTLDEKGKPVKGGKYGYLEDFDFRGTTVKDGVLTLKNIYVTDVNKVGSNTTLNGSNTRDKTVTKTASQSKYTGTVLVVDETGALKNYAERTERDAKGTVAEVYGHLTRPATVNGSSNAAPYNKYEDSANQNLPFAGTAYTVVKKGDEDVAVAQEFTDDEKKALKVLKNVQYGRVTTHLNQAKLENFKEGLSMGNGLETLVVGYGKFGDTGTENHYFYRGVDATTADQIAALKGNTFTYNGHAVSYGLDNQFKSFEEANSALPNALGFIYDAKLVSGNHVTAKVNFDTMKVTDGSIYNVWTVNNNGTTSDKLSHLVKFDGTLHKNGAITGQAANENKKGAEAAGVFAATLYGNQAQEMGGVISSNVKDAGKAWGAVFGANTADKPATPKQEDKPETTNPFTEATNKGK